MVERWPIAPDTFFCGNLPPERKKDQPEPRLHPPAGAVIIGRLNIELRNIFKYVVPFVMTRGPNSQIVGPRHEIQEIDFQVNSSFPLGRQWDGLPCCPCVDITKKNSLFGVDPQAEVEIWNFSLAFVMKP